MPLTKEPFRSYTLDEEKDTSYKIISLRLNKKEQEQLEELKAMFDTDQDGTAIKTAVEVGWNVLQHTFGIPLLQRLFSTHEEKWTGCNRKSWNDNRAWCGCFAFGLFQRQKA